MLSGASSLIDVSLGMEMLQYLPVSRMKALESLCLDARHKVAARGAVQAVMDCKQLRDLTIVRHDREPSYWPFWSLHIQGIPELDLRHLVHLRKCHLRCVPAPDKLLLSQGELELTMLPDHVEAWSKLWHQVRAHVRFITVEGYPCSSPIRLHEWPQGIDALRGLQFLQLNCSSVISGYQEPDIDLAHIAYVPHVSLYSEDCMFIKISKGTWRVLELECAGYCMIAIDDANAFLKGTKIFCFIFNTAQKLSWRPKWQDSSRS